MVPAPNLKDLIDTVHGDSPSDDPLDQLATASAVADALSEASDAVLGHYVDKARRSGQSWTQISTALGVSKQAAHKRFAPTIRRPRLDLFTSRARNAVECATDQARELGHPYVGTEHLLLGLIADADSVAGQVLADSGVSAAAVEREILERAPRRDTRPQGPLPHTPRAAAILEATIREAEELGHTYVGTEHLLLALYTDPVAATVATDSAYRTGGGLAANVLHKLGLDRGTAHAHIVEKLSGYRTRQDGETDPAPSP